ncbi:sensor histidine kinase [Rhizobium sophoriradicis]|uniref:histidine kinase n=1 Tax=Rhizobium sophoriradicis TaxID=1535245 RepID=A0A2A5KIQ1_9HYPH|nr:sensor histidine kinase [Rhizobium sophoriradicis]PCK76956.1 ATP-binding protein [Rhizobium sophoriradicis]
MRKKPLKFRPYARLLTMLGDQLIKNEQVALSELVKNAYDADASWVKVHFIGFDENYRAGEDAKIVIEDDGHGMTIDIIENHWANPATPVKLLGKKGKKARTAKGRIIQGEKGIGRFALLRLGRDIIMTTRPTGSPTENILELKLAKYDNDFLTGDTALFLEDLELELSETQPAKAIVESEIEMGLRKIRRLPQGTMIEISPPAGIWSQDKVDKVFQDLSRLQSIFSDPEDDASDAAVSRDFEVFIYRNGEYVPLGQEQRGKLDSLLSENSVLKVEGRYDEDRSSFEFNLDGKEVSLPLSDARISGLKVFREYLDKRGISKDEVVNLKTECGSFGYSFFVFDFAADAKGAHKLDKDDKDLLKQHRIYLYRDGIRVYPYGDADDDWLLIDVRRGTVRASEFVSNDQVVGFVNISQAENPQLRDKTSREGLVDTGHPVDDFKALLQTLLAWIRQEPYAKYALRKTQTSEVAIFRANKVPTLMEEAVAVSMSEGVPNVVREKIAEASREYKAERRYLVQRAETTEHLAGVGLSVEAASHDLMLAMSQVIGTIDKLILLSNRDGSVDKEALRLELTSMRGLLSFIQTQMKDMQLLFRSTKQRRKDIRITDLVEKVTKIFSTMLNRQKIDLLVHEQGAPLVAKTTDAVLLQLLLNLFDNAIYWLEGTELPRQIEIILDGNANTMTFSDSGPGFRADDVEYLFEPFFSGKGEEGRGLGLYIARQLLERHGYSIDVAAKDQRILRGANLVVSFVTEQE